MRPEARPPEINVTPLVDVVLVLLIIFMVVIPQLESGAAIDVPSARHADQRSDAEHEAISLGVTVSGEVFLDREPIARAALVVTAIGLVVAIPAVLAFNYLSARSDSLMMAIDQARGQLVDHLEAHPAAGSQEHLNARAA